MFPKKDLIFLALLLITIAVKSQITFSLSQNACTSVNYAVQAQSGTLSASGYSWTSLPSGVIFSSPNSSLSTLQFTSSGSYTISLLTQVSNSVITAAQITSVSSTPSLSYVQTSYTTCITSNEPKFSKPIGMTVIGATTYSWLPYIPPGLIPSNGQSQTIRPTVSSCYTVTGYNGVCSNTAAICNTVIPQFTISVEASSLIRCIPDSTKLFVSGVQNTALAPYTYSWTEDPLNTNITLNNNLTSTVSAFPPQITTYTVQVKDKSNCVSVMSSITVSVENCTSIKENRDNPLSIDLFPNPTSGRISVRACAIENIALVVYIYNISGVRVYIQNYEVYQGNGDIEFDLTRFNSGLYFVTVSNNKTQKSFKVIKE